MSRRRWWIAAAAAVLAVVLSSQLSRRGPAAGRAPAQREGAAGDAAAPAASGGSARFAVAVLPRGSTPAWRLEVRDAFGGLHEESGNGEREAVLGSLPAGAVLCTLRALGYVGGTVRLVVEEGREVKAALTLRRLGRVSGTLRCEGVPVAGALVQITIPIEAASSRIDLSAEDRAAGMNQSVQSDANGKYSFGRVLPAPGYSLVAASFDHAPGRVGPVEVLPGEELTVDFVLALGGHLSGRVVDFRGAPCDGATVNVLQRADNPRVVGWNDEARVRTDPEGRFLTPALTGPAVRMLKAWIVVDGVQQVIQFETVPPARGTKDVGTLAPHPGIALFELEGPVGDAPATLTVAVNGDPPGTGQTIVLTGAAFDREGRIRLAGLPVGEGVYSVMSGDGRAFSDGKFRPTGGDIVVKVPPLKQRKEQPPPAEQLIVEVPGLGEPALLVLIADGDFVLSREIPKGSSQPVVERVSPGRYTLLVCSGDRYAEKEVTQSAGQDLRVSVTPDRMGRAVTVRVLDEGKPVPGASVEVRGLRRDSRGLKVPWAKAGDDGRALLRGLPAETAEMTIIAMAADHGRGYSIDISGRDEVTVDLAKAPDED